VGKKLMYRLYREEGLALRHKPRKRRRTALHRGDRFRPSDVNQAWSLDFSRPGKPTDNAFVESFNGTLRAECLDVHWFGTLTEARKLIESWRREYNESRPHRSLGERTPHEFAKQIAASRDLLSLATAEN
jgi:transposase InsO family protein